jgi:Flp pilus assembly protein CpaB
MRASTLFALTLAILAGLGVAIAGKRLGLFKGPPPPEPPAKRPEVQALVAGRNLFAGDLIDTASVKVRPLRPEELEHYDRNKDDYVPPVVSAMFLRVADKNIYADQPILKSSLKDLAKPEPLNTRLLTRMRAINLALPKDQSAGGLIQVGDWVDVLLTCTIDRKDQGPTTRAACLIPNARVVAKRNSLWPIYAPLPEDKPIHYTLETNPYRAALLEFSRTRGQLSLAPLPSVEQQKLEAQREKVMLGAPEVTPALFGFASSAEGEDEELRVTAYNRGELAVTEGDLVRIFNITSPPPPLAAVPPLTIERLSGIGRYEPALFAPNGTRVETKASKTATVSPLTGRPPVADIRFSAPRDPNCKECEAMKKMKSSK